MNLMQDLSNNQYILTPSSQLPTPLNIQNLVAGYEQRVLLRDLFLWYRSRPSWLLWGTTAAAKPRFSGF